MCITQKRALLYDYHDDARHGSCLLAMHGQPLDGSVVFWFLDSHHSMACELLHREVNRQRSLGMMRSTFMYFAIFQLFNMTKLTTKTYLKVRKRQN